MLQKGWIENVVTVCGYGHERPGGRKGDGEMGDC